MCGTESPVHVLSVMSIVVNKKTSDNLPNYTQWSNYDKV